MLRHVGARQSVPMGSGGGGGGGVKDRGATPLHLGVLTHGTAGLQVGLPLHLNGNGVEVEGGDASLRHLSEDSLSVHRLVCGKERTEDRGEDGGERTEERMEDMSAERICSRLSV